MLPKKNLPLDSRAMPPAEAAAPNGVGPVPLRAFAPRVLMIDAVNPEGGTGGSEGGDGAVVRRLGRSADPLGRILDQLRSLPSVRELHLVCPGHPGMLRLGELVLTLERLAEDVTLRRQLLCIGRCLGPVGSIVLGGANAGHGRTGAAFLQFIADLAGVEVCALVRFRPPNGRLGGPLA
jgi:hypothetical protein